MAAPTDDWTALVDDAVHEINMRWGCALDNSDDPEFEPMDQALVRETAEAILRPIYTEAVAQRAELERFAVSDALDVIAQLITDTCKNANTAAVSISTFGAIGAGTGVGIYLKALQDAKAAIVVAGIKAYEEMPSSVSESILLTRREGGEAS